MFRLRQHRLSLACLCLLFSTLALNAPPGSAAAAPASPCADAQSVSKWTGSFNYSYVKAESGSTGAGPETADVNINHTANVTALLDRTDPGLPGNWYSFRTDQGAAGFNPLSGTATVADQGTVYANDGSGYQYTESTTGSGAPIVGPGSQSGLHVNQAACTYRFDESVRLSVVDRLGSNEFTEGLLLGAAEVFNRSIPPPDPSGAPPVLSGSVTLPVISGYTGSDRAWFGFASVTGTLLNIVGDNLGTATLSWTFTPGAAPTLTVAEIDLEQKAYPSGDWQTVPDTGTYDGNLVRMTAKIRNDSDTYQSATVRFKDRDGNLLPGGEITRSFPPALTIPVAYEWNSDGQAWKADGTPATQHRVEVWVVNSTRVFDFQNKDFKVRPRPVILVHGVNSNAAAWDSYPSYLHTVNPDWDSFAVDNMSTGSLSFSDPNLVTNSISQNAWLMAAFVEKVRSEHSAWHVDIVAHSMGGLISREYIQNLMPQVPENGPVARHLVMLGTPNLGSDCASLVSAALGASPEDIFSSATPDLIALYELTPYSVSLFNDRVQNRRGVQFSTLAGIPYAQRMWCGIEVGPNDGVVAKTSAFAIPAVQGTSPNIHTSLEKNPGDFNTFVRPQLTVGSAPLVSRPDVAATRTLTATVEPQLLYAGSAPLAANGTLTLPIALADGNRLSVSIYAPPEVGAALRSPAGLAVDSIAAGSAAAQPFIRALNADSPAAGTWTLQLTNTAPMSGVVPVAAVVEGSAISLALDAVAMQTSPQVRLQVAVSNGGAPMLGAPVTATLKGMNGQPVTVTLLDDGLHEDGAANDGLYGITTGRLTAQGYVVIAQTTVSGLVHLTTTQVAVPSMLYLPAVRR